jgi:hypothetical protein
MRKREQQALRRRERGEEASAEVSPEDIELALQLRQACKTQNVQQLMALYPAALGAGIINRRTTLLVCQALHTSVRRDAAKQGASRLSTLLPFVEQVISDLRRGALPPHPYAYVHLLGIYKDAKRFKDGRALWLWLAQQDEAHVSQAAYGAAIELMAYGNMANAISTSLAELEQLYEEGLKRFPGTFAEYHLSPDAIVPDRTQPVHILGLPTTLLQGIITARLLFHDWKKAYLGLDTILRLYPGQTPHRIFELFITERPITEAYTAFLLACRSGEQISGSQVTSLLNRLRVSMTMIPSLSDRFIIVRAIANALYAYQQCGGGLASIHVGIFIKAFEFVLPEKAPDQDFTDEETVHRNTIAVAAHECLVGLIQSGLSPERHPFVSLISLAGKLRAPDLLKMTFDYAKAAGITFGPIERRTLLTAAGLIRDRDLIQALWSLVVSGAEKEGTQLSYYDWITFAKACRRADYLRYIEQQLQDQAHTITAAIERRVRSEICDSEPGAANQSIQLLTPEQLNSEIQMLQGQMENIRAVLMSGQPLNMEKSPFYMHVDPNQPSLGSEEDLRAIYDELTTDPHQPAPAPDSPEKAIAPALSKSGIPLDRLRFLNWINVHEMMSLASDFHTSQQSIVDKAIAQRKSIKDITEVPLLRTETKPAESQVDLRNRIKELRNPDQVFRKVSSQVADAKFKPMTHVTEKDTWHTTKISKHITKPFTVRKFVTETPDDVFQPMTRDPQTSRWHTRKITKIHSDAKYNAAEVKSRFEAYGDEKATEKAAEEPALTSEAPVAKTSAGDSVPWIPS